MNDPILSSHILYDSRVQANRVLRLQRLLRTLSRSAAQPLWNTAENGIYDEETREAVRNFQRSCALPVTGEADLPTWQRLRDLYAAQTSAAPIGIRPFPPNRRITDGERSDLVLQLQILLNALRMYYDAIPPIPLSGIYDTMTANAVRTFREINRLPVSRDTDAAVWNRLTEEINRIARENP